ncbi:hypothetical protein GQ85_08225 [Rhodococcus rhodochrous]|nr:hypothetical protein GQ85_08225 [Rhodococcus rhodochrous]
MELSGRAEVFTWTRVEHAFDAALVESVPYVTGLVTPIEAPHVRLVVRFLDDDASLCLGASMALTCLRLGASDKPYLAARRLPLDK